MTVKVYSHNRQLFELPPHRPPNFASPHTGSDCKRLLLAEHINVSIYESGSMTSVTLMFGSPTFSEGQTTDEYEKRRIKPVTWHNNLTATVSTKLIARNQSAANIFHKSFFLQSHADHSTCCRVAS